MSWPKGKPRDKKKQIEWERERHHGVKFSTRKPKKDEDIAPNVLIPKGTSAWAPVDMRPTSVRMMEMLLRRKLSLAEKIAAEYRTRVQVYAELLEALERL